MSAYKRRGADVKVALVGPLGSAVGPTGRFVKLSVQVPPFGEASKALQGRGPNGGVLGR